MQLNAAPGETLVQKMRERGRLTKIPLPTALTGKGFGKVRQIRGFVRRDNFRFDTFAVVGKKGFRDGLTDLLMGDARQQLR